MINLIPIGKRGENGGLNIVSPTGNNFPIGNMDFASLNLFTPLLCQECQKTIKLP